MSADRNVTLVYIMCLYIYRCPLIVMLLLYTLCVYIFIDVRGSYYTYIYRHTKTGGNCYMLNLLKYYNYIYIYIGNTIYNKNNL